MKNRFPLSAQKQHADIIHEILFSSSDAGA